MKIYDKNYILDFRGGHLEIPLHADFDLSNSMTIAAWIKPESGTGLQATILSKFYTAYELQVQNGKLVLERGPEYSGNIVIDMNSWVYVAVSFDATEATDNLKLYINGDLDKAYTVNAPLTKTDKPLWIGGRPDNTLFFTGQMASVALWNVAHNGWQIKQDYGSPIDTSDPALVGYWKMEEGNGSVVKDFGSKGHNATIVGNVSWQGVQEPVAVRVPPVKRIRNTTVQRIDQLLADPSDTHEEDHSSLPASGRNGEATRFLNRVTSYKTSMVADKTRETDQQIKEAKAAKADKLKQAHLEAAKKMNSTRFDTIWFIYYGRIHYVDPHGKMSEFYVGNVETVNKTVPANQKWFDTGVNLAAGETVRVQYQSGRWSVSPFAANLTATGSAVYTAKPGYALPGVPEGALIGRIGNGAAFHIGNNYEVPVGQTGKLFLTANDDQNNAYGVGYADNSGSLAVKIDHIKQAVSVEASDLMLDQARDLVCWSQATVPFTLHMANINGSGHKKLFSHPENAVTSVALDELNQYVYHIIGTGHIMRVKYDGSDHKTILDISGPAKSHYWQLEIEPKGKKMYWTNDYSIWRADLDGKNAELIVPNSEAPYPIDLAVDGESSKLYWVDKELGVVRCANLDGSDPHDLHAAKNPIRGLMLDYVTPDMRDVLKQEVYWAAREEQITGQTPGIVGYWPLDEGKGTSFTDTINPFVDYPLGMERTNIELPQGVEPSTFSLVYNASDYAQVPNRYINGLRNSSFTIEMWIRPNSIPDSQDTGLLAGTHYAAHKCLHLIIRNQKAYLGFYTNDLAGKTVLKPNKWTHLAFRYDKAKQEQAIFVNGNLDASSNGHVPLDNDPDVLTLLGSYANGAYFDGLIADLRIIHQPLSDAAIQSTVHTYKPGNIMAEVNAGPTWIHDDTPPTLYPMQSVLEFNGASNYLRLGTATELGINNDSFTIESWVKVADYTKGGDVPVVGTDEAATNKGLHLVIRNQKPYLGFYSNDLAGNTTIQQGEWYHIAWRYDAGTREQAIFVNGKKDASRTAAENFLGQGEVFLGRSFVRTLFKGRMSDLRIWSLARTDQEIASNYRHYRESFALRGPVDGSEQPEHLFEIPAEGGLNLVSRLKKEYELRLLAYRKRKENQIKAAADIQQAHTEKDRKIGTKSAELHRTEKETSTDITNKKAEHEQDRTANRASLLHAQTDKSKKIDNARKSAQQRRASAELQATDVKQKANTDAASMKNNAHAQVNSARAERDKYKH